MPKQEFIEYFNKQNYSWKITEYEESDKFFGGGINLTNFKKGLDVETYDLEIVKDLPANFDARRKWSQCRSIKEIYDQGDCSSGFAFGVANTVSDRTCIHKGDHVHLSEQDFECMKKDVCFGGDPYQAFEFWIREGLVTRNCKPYNVRELKKNQCKEQCERNTIKYSEDKHYGLKVIEVPNDLDQIKAELFHQGPVQASFVLYQDFRDYREGIYEQKYGKYLGEQSVRVIGYGVYRDTQYWLVANSWGRNWGENGYVKVKMSQNIKFEEYMLTGRPK
ncbi:gut-specific cysteine proteinase-like [Anticarsia gemmatalis]|uniref:gut-specific cysteine proteinase-like n=1 Tax=Anticarsia gemmatalis TaxID=129554 RepID=UPI003F765924